MENLQYIVDKTVNFYKRTVLKAKLEGPFTEKDLESMFTEAHFCSDLLSLPPVYQNLVENIQEKYNLLLAPQILLVSLADNLRVNKQSLDKARELFDKEVKRKLLIAMIATNCFQGSDLNSWLLVKQRESSRKQFLDLSQKLKDTDLIRWNSLK